MLCRACRQPHLSCARGQRLRELRRAHGHTQETFAELVYISPRHVRRLESGERPVDTLRLLERIARALGMELAALLDALDGVGVEDRVTHG